MSRLEQISLTIFVCAAVGAFGSSYRTPAWLLLLPCAVSPLWRLKRVPPAVQAWTRYIAWTLLGGAVVLGLIFMAYPVLEAQTAARLTLVAGYSLALFSTLFLLGTPAWPPAWTLFPVTVGTLMVACLNPAARLEGLIATAGIAVVAYLILGSKPRAPLARLASSVLGTFLIAWGIIWLLPWAQARVEQATYRLYGSGSTHYSALSRDSRLGDLEQLKLSRKVVMRLWSSRPQKLRGRVFTQFDGQAWHARGFAATRLSPVPESLPLGKSAGAWLDTIPGSVYLIPGTGFRDAADAAAIRTRIVQTVFNEGMLVSPAHKLLVRLPSEDLRLDAFEGLAPAPSSTVRIYGVINRTEGGAPQPPGDPAEFLALPPDTDARLKELAARLSTGAPSAEERLERTVRFVENECRYSLNVGKFRTRQPVAEFLFEKKQGYCQYFASATAVLLRLQGVPSRYVTGFNLQSGNFQAGHYVVREADAHAWVEAYLPGQGWVEADPTPEAEYQALHAGLGNGWMDNAGEWLKAKLAEISIWIREGYWRAALRRLWLPALAVIIVPAALALGWRFRKLRFGRRTAALGPPEPGEPAPELRELLSRLDGLWARRGFARPPSRAPLEHLAAIPPEKISAELREVSGKVIACFYRASFGGVAVDPGEIRALQEATEGPGKEHGTTRKN